MKDKLRRVLAFVLRKLEKSPVTVEVGILNVTECMSGIRAVITGGAKGIGFAIASAIVSHGGRVLITGRQEESLKRAKEQLGEKCEYEIFDSTDFDNMHLFFAKIENRMPNVNALVLNAGVSHHESSFTEVSLMDFDTQFLINLKSNYFLAQNYIKYIGKGQILFISSETADMKCVLPYGLTKACLNSLIPSLACKYGKDGLRINGIAPGSTLTDMVKNINGNPDDYYYKNMAGRYFLASEVAQTAIFLLSDCSKCINGEIIHTNSGNHYRPQ